MVSVGSLKHFATTTHCFLHSEKLTQPTEHIFVRFFALFINLFGYTQAITSPLPPGGGGVVTKTWGEK